LKAVKREKPDYATIRHGRAGLHSLDPIDSCSACALVSQVTTSDCGCIYPSNIADLRIFASMWKSLGVVLCHNETAHEDAPQKRLGRNQISLVA
jgi:hypothetical protein